MNRLGFFPYDALDYKAAQADLDRRAAAGWVLQRVELGFLARFRPGEGHSHFVDLDLSRSIDGGPDPDYLQLCADAGWEKVQTLRGMLLFRSAPGARPAPIQTDDALEQERFWKKYVRRNLLGSLLPLALFLLVWWLALSMAPGRAGFPAALTASNGALLFLAGMAAALLLLGWTWCSTLLYYRRCRAAGRMAEQGRTGAVLRGWLSLAVLLLLILSTVLSLTEDFGLGQTADLRWSAYEDAYTATPEACEGYPVLTGADLGLDWDGSSSRFLEVHRSVLAEFTEYREVVRAEDGGLHTLTTERYECAGAGPARWVLDRRRTETAQGGFLWGTLSWVEAPGLGFDESWRTAEGDYLLLRQGRVVALAGASEFDLTSPENLGMLRERLDLEAQ